MKREDVTVAALLLQPFTLYLIALHFVAAPSVEEWAHADPILTLLPGRSALWLAPVVGVTTVAVWWRLAPPSAAALRAGALNALLGALLAALGVLSVRGNTVIPATAASTPNPMPAQSVDLD